MLVYTEAEKQKIRADSSHKELLITFLDDDTFESIGNDRIYQESLTLVESLCDDENLKFGECESAELKIQVADVTEDIKSHEIQLDLTVNGVLVPLGIYYISNVEKATDKRYKKLTCYDRMIYFQINVIEWYNGLFSTVDTTHTLKEVRDSFFEWMGIEQVNTTLPNDNMIVRKTIDAQELSGLKVIWSICEINGMFGHITRDGRFKYVSLIKKGPYPSTTLFPSATLFPGTVEKSKIEQINNSNYLPGAERGDYVVKGINKLQVRSESGDVGAIITSDNYTDDTNNSYIVTDNFLVYGSGAEELQVIAQNMSKNVFGITYTPHSTPTVAMPYMEVGDIFDLNAINDNFRSFILKRTLSGIQGMKDLWESYGNEYQPDIVEESNQEIIKLQSRVNILTRTVDETKLEIVRVESDIQGNIETLDSKITQTANEIQLSVNQTLQSYSTTEQMNSAINLSAAGITSSVSKTYETKTNAQSQYNALSTSISQTAESINLKADKNGLIGQINVSSESVKISADKLELEGIATFIGNQGYVTEDDLGADGTTTINGGRIDTESLFSREITATNLKLTKDSTIQLGANNLAEKQYIYLVGNTNGVVYETGMFPSRFYTISNDGYSVNIVPSGISFGSPKGEALNIIADSDGVIKYNARLSHEFTLGDVIVHTNLGFIDGNDYIDIIKTLKNARDAGVISLVNFNGQVV